jgi:hypothetical protein
MVTREYISKDQKSTKTRNGKNPFSTSAVEKLGISQRFVRLKMRV